MKKLRIFAGVSTLALVVAGTNAFGAATNATDAYGVYDPECEVLGGDINVVFYGFVPSTGVFDKVASTTINADTSAWGTNLNLDTLSAKINDSITVNGIKYSTGLTPRGAILYSIGGAVPTESIYTEHPALIVSKTTSDWNPANMIGTDESGLSNILSFGFGPDGGFPAVTSTNVFAIKLNNTNTIHYVLAYAANCVAPTGSVCSLTIKGVGGAYYRNSCNAGYKRKSFGDMTPMCANKCADVSTHITKGAYQESKTPSIYK